MEIKEFINKMFEICPNASQLGEKLIFLLGGKGQRQQRRNKKITSKASRSSLDKKKNIYSIYALNILQCTLATRYIGNLKSNILQESTDRNTSSTQLHIVSEESQSFYFQYLEQH